MVNADSTLRLADLAVERGCYLPLLPQQRLAAEKAWKEMDMRTDFENLQDGDKVKLYPNENNPLHKKPVNAIYSGGYFFCEGSPTHEGPDYYMGDVLAYNNGFEAI